MATSDEPRDMLVECPACEGPVIGKPQGHYVYADQEQGPPERWTLLACATCYQPLLVQQLKYGGGMTFEDDDAWRAYPPQDQPLSQRIPDNLRSSHAEARSCFRVKAYVATVAMCGRTLELLCTDKGTAKDRLQDSLKEMKRLGFMDDKLWDWAETLRDVRNTASHGGPKSVKQLPITRQDAEDSLALNEALLDYIYVLTERFSRFKARRQEGSPVTPSVPMDPP